MAHSPPSPWDFGDLFEREPARRVFTVAELTLQVKRLLERQVGSVWVTGEVSGLRVQASGHIYFTLKDAASQLSCTLFRSETATRRDLLREGAQVLLRGDLTVYEPRGQYQLVVRALEMQGRGALQEAFEMLKQKLAAQGLFDPGRKRALPRFPRRIGIVTSPTGAAFADVRHVMERRFAGIELVLAPSRVQGQGAAAELAQALRLLNTWSAMQPEGEGLNVILLTRGGGSLEDLWAFNEEVLARAIGESALPVVSAVGHEIDFTISDLVADLRAATPSAAAEILTQHYVASRELVSEAVSRLRLQVRRGLDEAQTRRMSSQRRLKLAHPRRGIEARAQRLDEARSALLRVAGSRLRDKRAALEALVVRARAVRPTAVLIRRAQRLKEQSHRLREMARQGLAAGRVRQLAALGRLRLLNPQNVLARGYSITTDEATGRVLRDAREIRAGQKLRTRLSLGQVRSTAEG